MAKKPQRKTTEPVEPNTPSQKTLRLIDGIKRPFLTFMDEFGAITASRRELAPAFMRAFEAWRTDTAGNFVGFVRMLVPDVPANRDGYREHPAYQAADYLRRLAAIDAAPREPVPPELRPATPLVALARVVATVLPMLGPNAEALWAAFIEEMHWSAEQVARFQGLVNRSGPMAALQGRVGRRAVNGYALPATGTTAASSRH